MAVNLQKGQKVDLTKGNAGLKKVIVALGWDEAQKKVDYLVEFKILIVMHKHFC